MDGGYLKKRDREILEMYGCRDSAGGFAVIRYLMNRIRKDREKGNPAGTGAQKDPETALWMARACLALGDYEHCRMAVQWMERTKVSEEEEGERCILIARGMMYCGNPEGALKWALKAAEQNPELGRAWYTAAELLYLAGRTEEALQAAEKGKNCTDPAPEVWDFNILEKGIRESRSLEEMEKERICREADIQGEKGSRAEKMRLEAADGICRDEAGLKAVLEELSPEIWDRDEPYCAFCFWPNGRELTGAFCMNEASVSKWRPEEVKKFVDALPVLEQRGKEILGGDGELCLLEFYPDHTAGLIFETEEGEKKAAVSSELEVRAEADIRKKETVFLSGTAWNPEQLAEKLAIAWGVEIPAAGENGRLLFRDGGLTIEIAPDDRTEEDVCLILTVSGEEGKERDTELELKRLVSFCTFENTALWGKRREQQP